MWLTDEMLDSFIIMVRLRIYITAIKTEILCKLTYQNVLINTRQGKKECQINEVGELRKMDPQVFSQKVKQLSFTFNFRRNHARMIKLFQKVKECIRSVKINFKKLWSHDLDL